MRACLALVIVFAAAGCGSDDRGGQGGPPLSVEGYRQIERLYRAQLPADQVRSPGEFPPLAKAVSRACARLDRSDRLLATFADSCDEALGFLAAGSRLDCRDERACVRALRRMAGTIDPLVAEGRRSERVVAMEVADRECRKALSPPGIYDKLERLKRGLERTASVVETGDRKAATAASTELQKVQAELKEIGSARTLFDRFREACRP